MHITLVVVYGEPERITHTQRKEKKWLFFLRNTQSKDFHRTSPIIFDWAYVRKVLESSFLKIDKMLIVKFF